MNNELSQGTFACDLCGVTSPHSHDPEYVETERYVRPSFERTTVPRGWFAKITSCGPYLDGNTEVLWQHFLSGWFAAKEHYRAFSSNPFHDRMPPMQRYEIELDAALKLVDNPQLLTDMVEKIKKNVAENNSSVTL